MNLTSLTLFGFLCFGLGFLSAYFLFKTEAPAPPHARPEQPVPAPAPVPADPTANAAPPPAALPPIHSEPKPAILNLPNPAPENVLSGALGRAGRIFEKPARPVGKTISSQIDAILQDRLVHSADLNLNLHLVDLEDHSLGVVLNGQTFNGIEAVPDERAKALIRSAVAEWQRMNQ